MFTSFNIYSHSGMLISLLFGVSTGVLGDTVVSIQRDLLRNRLPSVRAFGLCARSTICLLSLFASAQPFGQVASPSATATGACIDLSAGIVVESVAKNSESERAGLAEGDVILGWGRGDAKGQIRSPFDLNNIEIEQEPRGKVTLEGTRATTRQIWVMGPDWWGLTTRPNLLGAMLADYREGQELVKAGKLVEATDRWQEAAAEGQKHPCSGLSPWFLFHAAEVLAKARQWKESDALYQQAIERTAESEPDVKVEFLRAWAGDTFQRGDLAKAEEYTRQALVIEEKLAPGSLGVAIGLTDLGRAAFRHRELAKAEEYHREALVIEEKLAPGSLDVAISLTDLGVVAQKRGDLVKAEEYSRQALAILEKHTSKILDVAINLDNLGAVAEDRGDLAKTEEYYRRALVIREKVAPGSLHVAASLNNLGSVAFQRGDLAKAVEYYRQALVIQEKLAPGGLSVATSLNNLGTVARDRGDLAKAEEYFRQELDISEKKFPGTLEMAVGLSNLGSVAFQRGDLAKTEKYERQALVIREKLSPGSLGVAFGLNNLGKIAFVRRDLAKAEEYYRQALVIKEKVAPGSLYVAASLHDLGGVAFVRGNPAKAEEYHRQALAIREKLSPGSLYVGESLTILGELMSGQRDLAKSEEYFRQALDITKRLAPESAAYAESLAGLAKTLRDEQNPDEAARLYAETVDVLDRQLSHLGGSSEARSGFRAKLGYYYSQYADLLLTKKNADLAFEVTERARARTLLETLAESHADIRQGADPSVIEKERLLQATLTAKTNRKINLLKGEHTDEELTAIKNEISDVLAQYEELEGQIRSSSPKYAGLTQPKPLGLGQVQRLLDADTVLLDYVLGSEHSYLFVVTPNSLDSYELPKRSQIESKVAHGYGLLTSHNRRVVGESSEQRKARLTRDEVEYEKTVAELSEMVLGPVTKQVKGKRLLIVADGALQYVPFGALPVPSDGKTQPAIPLLAEHEIVNLPSASVLAVLRRQAEERDTKPTKEVAVLADPVFDKSDPRVSTTLAGKSKRAVLEAETQPTPESSNPSIGGYLARSLEDVRGTGQEGVALPRLVFSRREASAIMAATRAGDGMEAVDFQASRETAMSQDLSQYRILHFATHGLLDNEHPELSGLVLSMVGPDGQPRDGFLDLEDIYNLTLSADLVVLSACQTGLGKEIRGEGLIGLTRGFMYAGASRVVASLWQVDDAATAELMGVFYKAMLKDGLRPAAALRQAQMELMKEKRWHDPYYWAAFTLQGEWK